MISGVWGSTDSIYDWSNVSVLWTPIKQNKYSRTSLQKDSTRNMTQQQPSLLSKEMITFNLKKYL